MDSESISYISGPTSYYYLEPTRRLLPPILLFGDMHPSGSKNFEDGDARRCDGLSGVTHKVDEPAFIETLASFLPRDSLFPIDIYLEDFLGIENGQTKADGPLSRLCQMSDEKIFAPRVRWHRVDAREYVNRKPAIEVDIVRAMAEGDTQGFGAVDKHFLELKDHLHELLQVSGKKTDINGAAQYMAPRICEILRYPRPDHLSVVRDQIHKALLNDPNQFWWRFVEDSLQLSIVDYYRLIEQHEPDAWNEEGSLKECVRKAVKLWLVDIYTVLRMLKMPAGGFLGGLCMGYHGGVHTRNIARILESSRLYSTAMSKPIEDFFPEGGLPRCLGPDFDAVLKRVKNGVADHCKYLGRGVTEYAARTVWRYASSNLFNESVAISFWSPLSICPTFDTAKFLAKLEKSDAPCGVVLGIIRAFRRPLCNRAKVALLRLSRNLSWVGVVPVVLALVQSPMSPSEFFNSAVKRLWSAAAMAELRMELLGVSPNLQSIQTLCLDIKTKFTKHRSSLNDR